MLRYSESKDSVSGKNSDAGLIFLILSTEYGVLASEFCLPVSNSFLPSLPLPR